MLVFVSLSFLQRQLRKERWPFRGLDVPRPLNAWLMKKRVGDRSRPDGPAVHPRHLKLVSPINKTSQGLDQMVQSISVSVTSADNILSYSRQAASYLGTFQFKFDFDGSGVEAAFFEASALRPLLSVHKRPLIFSSSSNTSAHPCRLLWLHDRTILSL